VRRDCVELSGEKKGPKQFIDPGFTPLFYVTQPTANVICLCSTVLRHRCLSRLLQRSTLTSAKWYVPIFGSLRLPNSGPLDHIDKHEEAERVLRSVTTGESSGLMVFVFFLLPKH
jgi:hypothetical protein